eukprot:UN05959
MDSDNEEIVAPSSPAAYEEEEDGEDLFATANLDNQFDPELDRYEDVADDNEDVVGLTVGQRQAAEREMYERDVRGGRNVQAPVGMESPGEMEEQYSSLQQVRMQDNEMEEDNINLEDFSGPLQEWLQEERVQRAVKRKFREFLTSFRDEAGKTVYPNIIQKMTVANLRTLPISFSHLCCSYPILAIWTADCPAMMLELFDDVATIATNDIMPGYHGIHENIRVRLTDLPVTDKLRDLRHRHLNMLVRVTGVVTRRTNVFPQLEAVRFDCTKCGYVMGPYMQRGAKDEVRPPSCPQCSSKGPFRLNVAETVYRNYQRITLQESPGSVKAGRVPRSKEVILIDDLVDTVKPGEEIDVTGIYINQFDSNINIQTGFPVFTTVIEANYILSREEAFQKNITDEERKHFLKLSKRPDLSKLIINSIAPSIYGYEYIKQALAFAMFGGMEKQSKQKHRVRGDINVLILGDPGVGKSQFLKWVENVAPRSVYATGKGASAVGLTASVRRDPVTQEFTLEGGALVLADRGVCLIDEFDKMNEQDRTSIHEAMEQQSISISKAGIVTRLQARCAVIAAANPIGGRYDGSLSFIENVELTDPILSRFDVLAIVRDRVDPVRDEQLASWVVSNHIRSHPERDEMDNEKDDKKKEDRPEHLDTDTLKKYIMFAKTECQPKLHNIDKNKISRFYADIRQKSMEGGGIPIAVRHIESVLRMAEANAKMHLRSSVVDEDVDIAIRTLLQSFIATQKRSVKMPLKKHFQSYLQYKRDNVEILMHILKDEVLDQSHFHKEKEK